MKTVHNAARRIEAPRRSDTIPARKRGGTSGQADGATSTVTSTDDDVVTAARAVAEAVQGQVGALEAEGGLPFSREYFDRDRGLKHTSFPVWQTKTHQMQGGGAARTLIDPACWSAIELEAYSRLDRALPDHLTVLDVEVRKVQVRRYGTTAKYRVTLGGQGARASDLGAPPDAPTALAAAIWGEPATDAAVDTIVQAFEEKVRGCEHHGAGCALPFRRRYTNRECRIERPSFDVWQSTSALDLRPVAAADALMRGGPAWEDVERAARVRVQASLPDCLELMDVQIMQVERRRAGASLEVRLTARRAQG